MKTASVVLVALLATTTMSFGQAYSTGFEYANQAALAAGLTADGWVNVAFNANLETTIVHSGTSAMRLMPRVHLQRPVNDFGTLNLWVYDEGLIPTTNANGGRWGLCKGTEAIAGQMFHRSFVPCAIVYAPNNGFSGNVITAGWFSSTWLDAGDLSGFALDPPVDTRSRGVAGWMNWEIIYTPAGLIEINLLVDPNGGGAKGHSSHTIGTPIAPDVSSAEFFDPATGGADAIYLFGSWDTDGATPPVTPFGDLIVDDLTWTPYAGGPQADFDGDGDVDLDDFVILKTNFGTGTTHAQGDADGDADVDLDDFVILKNEFGS